jgi:spectinomycin phosphotransferase
MREPPKLAEAALLAALNAHYGLAVAALTFLPIGNDAASSAFHVVAADGGVYFLKVRAEAGFSPPSLLIPRHLHDQGVPHIVAPLPTLAGALWIDLEGYALSLYPFLEARTAVEAGLSEGHWRAFGATLRQIHLHPLPPDLAQLLPRETFTPSRRSVLTELEAALTHGALKDRLEHELARVWQAHRDNIHTVIERADALGRRLRRAGLPLALCHADLHTWNVLLDAAGQFWIVDWDEIVLAPKERDLMFVIGGIGRGLVSASETETFLRGYGEADIDPAALAYYRYAWAAQDMGAYGEQVFFVPDLSEAARREAMHGFADMFAPGNIVALALESDGAAP